MSEEGKYKQLGLFGTIVGLVVITPGILGGVTYKLLSGHPYRIPFSVLAVLVGLGLGFYRIFLLNQQLSKQDDRDSPKS